jgi:hypothetical protein
MNHANTLKHQAAFRDWAVVDHWACPHAVSLTLKQGVKTDDDLRSVQVFLDPDKASQNLRHFHNDLSRKVLGKGRTRAGERLPMIPVLEGGTNGSRYHYHIVIDCPPEEADRFPALIRETWEGTQWGYHEIDVQLHYDGWIDYISKTRGKPNLADAIDWANVHMLDCRV